MKKIKVLCGFLFCTSLIQAQRIILSSDNVILKPNNKSKNYILSYTITGATSSLAKYKVTITDNAEGTAIAGKDYVRKDVDTNSLWTVNDSTKKYEIKLKETDICDIANKTIILHIKAIPPSNDTTYTAVFTLTIHRSDTLDETAIKTCRIRAKQRGENWNKNNKIERNIDNTNTPKTEFLSYTDFKGFDPDQPNGLAQNQFLFKWPIEKHWIINHEKFKFQIFRSFIFPNFLFNRIDKTNDALLYKTKYDSIDTNNDRIADSFPIRNRNINSFDLIKYSNFILNGKLTLINMQFENSRVMLEWDVSMYRMRVDTNKISKIFDPIYAISHGPHLFFETGIPGLSDAFQLRNIIGYEILRMRSSSFSQIDAISSNVIDGTPDPKVRSDYTVNRSSKIWSLSARLSRSVSKENKSIVFFKYSISWQKLKKSGFESNIVQKHFNQYSQFQFGFLLDINIFGQNK